MKTVRQSIARWAHRIAGKAPKVVQSKEKPIEIDTRQLERVSGGTAASDAPSLPKGGW